MTHPFELAGAFGAKAAWLLTVQVEVRSPVRRSDEAETHTLPVALMVGMALAGVAALALLYVRKRRVQEAVDAQFKGFRERAVALMDQLDALRKRQQELPTADADFTEPMTGATLLLYQGVGADLDALWERWLRVMEIWQTAQARLRTDSGVTTRAARDAGAMLKSGDLDRLHALAGSCKTQLDRLNVAHERARAALKSGRHELALLRGAVDRGTGVLLPGDPHRAEIESAEAAFAEAEGRLVSDPIGAEHTIQETRQAIGAASMPPQRILGRPWGPSATSIFDDLASAADGLRSTIARLRVFDLIGWLVRIWLIVWVAGLLLALFTSVLPLALLAFGLLVMLTIGGWFVRLLLSFLGIGTWTSRRYR
jgi:hypothetical protein